MLQRNPNGQGSVIGRDPESPAVVFPVCTNRLLQLGLESVLSGAGFVVWHDMIDDVSNLPEIRDEKSALFIVDKASYAGGIIDLIGRLRTYAPEAKIVILADVFEPDAVSAAWNAGAHGFCLSTRKQDVLVASLELVMLGEIVLPASVALPIAEIGTPRASEPETAARDATAMDRRRGKLSNREAEILVCLKEGDPNKAIARKLNLSEATVKVHVKSILKKVGACNRTQAALWATQHISARMQVS